MVGQGPPYGTSSGGVLDAGDGAAAGQGVTHLSSEPSEPSSSRERLGPGLFLPELKKGEPDYVFIPLEMNRRPPSGHDRQIRSPVS